MGRERRGKAERVRSALSIAGLDPCGGAGISADLRAFRATGAWGAAACAALTVQSTRGVTAVHAVGTETVRAQVEEVLADLDVRAIKTGALGSEDNVLAVAALLAAHRSIPAVVDPVMAPSRARAADARLDGRASSDAIWRLVRAAALVTPNADEASALLGRQVRTSSDGRAAAEDLVRAGARAVLVKGGHLEGDRAVDWFATPRTLVAIARTRRTLPPVHGTGCTLSALVAGRLALRARRGAPSDDDLLAAVRWARAALDRALSAPVVAGAGARVLDVPAAKLGARVVTAGAP